MFRFIVAVCFAFCFAFPAYAEKSQYKSEMLLGINKHQIKKIVTFTEDCLSDIDRSVAIIGGIDANKILPFNFGDNDYIELEFDSCLPNAAVISASIPINELKFNELKKFYLLVYGDPVSGSYKNHLIWYLSGGNISLVKLFKSKYAFIVSINQEP